MTNPFDRLTKSQVNRLLELLGSHTYRYKKGEEILPTIKSENIIAIILYGHAQIVSTDYNGNEIIVEELKENSIFGSSISLTNSDSCEIICKDDSVVVVLDYDKLLNENNLRHFYFNIFSMNLFDIINTKIKEKNERIRVLEKKQIRERLLEYFEILYKKANHRTIYLPFTFRDLADYIAVNRSAMFRELKNLKEEKLIEVKGQRITLVYK